MVFDLKKETVGFFFIDCISKGINTIKVSFGEYLINNHVQRIIHSRDFSFDLTLKDGNNSLTNYLRKLGLRYLEVEYNENIVINKIGLIPIEYPFNVRSKTLDDNLDNMIYQTSIRTLILNAFDHYTDCPWREQGFYALDSYLQMKYHYLCFDNFEYQRTCLKLLSQDRSNSGLTSLTYPTSCKLVIPSFSLYYIISMEEYAAKTNDYTLIKDYYTKLLSVLNVFIDNMKDGLLQNFKGNNYWNFYEWNESLDGVSVQCDAALNLNFVLALNAMLKICSYLDKAEDYLYFESLRNNIKTNINKVFLNKETNLYETYKGVNTSELVLSYAIISNTCPESLQAFLASELMSEKHIPCTLSMLYFKYEALIKVNKKNITYVINDIRKKYGYMLTLDATSFFETIKGKDDFDGAGSLCHGWSALPIYFYKLFEEIKEK